MTKSEAQIRSELIDQKLALTGWNVKDPTQVVEEYDILTALPDGVAEPIYAMKAIETTAFEESISFAESQIGLLALTEDSAEGQLAYREKRAPVWTGR